MDIALDTFPQNGGGTTVDAMLMGVPVVSLAGDHFVSRLGVTYLKATGAEELLTDSPEAYIAKAESLAADLPRLNALRQSLRGKLLHSPVCDSEQFTRDLA